MSTFGCRFFNFWPILMKLSANAGFRIFLNLTKFQLILKNQCMVLAIFQYFCSPIGKKKLSKRAEILWGFRKSKFQNQVLAENFSCYLKNWWIPSSYILISYFVSPLESLCNFSMNWKKMQTGSKWNSWMNY